jgi:hypothetical protein
VNAAALYWTVDPPSPRRMVKSSPIRAHCFLVSFAACKPGEQTNRSRKALRSRAPHPRRKHASLYLGQGPAHEVRNATTRNENPQRPKTLGRRSPSARGGANQLCRGTAAGGPWVLDPQSAGFRENRPQNIFPMQPGCQIQFWPGHACATGAGICGSTPRHPTGRPCTASFSARNRTTYIICL